MCAICCQLLWNIPRGIEMASVCTAPARGGRLWERFGGYKTINRIPVPLPWKLHCFWSRGQIWPLRVLEGTGCNIGCKTPISEQGKLPLKLTCPTGTSTCPATLLKEILDFAQNITWWVGQVRVFFSLPHCRFMLNSLATGPVVKLHHGEQLEFWGVTPTWHLLYIKMKV